jgi:hypothetical protein
MKMRTLLNIALPFMHHSGDAAMVMNRALIMGTPPDSKPDYVPGTAPRVLYGLPCARCGAYYPADLAICPMCNSAEKAFPKPKPTAWPASVPRSTAVEIPREGNLGGLATINRELLVTGA